MLLKTLATFLLLLTLCSCSQSDDASLQPNYYLVSSNNLGLREGFLEVGNVVELQDSTLNIYEPGRADWSANYSIVGDSFEVGRGKYWRVEGDSLLSGPEGNDYRLERIEPAQQFRLDSLFEAGVRYRTPSIFASVMQVHYFLPADTTGGACFIRYTTDVDQMDRPANIKSLPKSVQKMLLRYRATPPDRGYYHYDRTFGRPLLAVNTARGRTVYRVESVTADSLVLQGYSNLSPTSTGRSVTWYRMPEPVGGLAGNSPLVWAPKEDPRHDSLGWSQKMGESDRREFGDAPFEEDLPELRIEYVNHSLALFNRDRQVWRRPVRRVAPDLLLSSGGQCAANQVYPLQSEEDGSLTLLVPMHLRRPSTFDRIGGLDEVRESFTTQFRMQPFGNVPQ